MSIKIIGIGESTRVLLIITCLNELGLPFELDPPSSLADLKTEDYIANKHPFGKIPVLYDGDFKITESRAICRYLVSKYQGKHNNTVLIPNDVHKAGLVDQFIFYESFYYDPVVSKLLFQEVYSEKYHGKASDPEIVKQTREEIAKVLDIYERLLERKEYLNGEYSLADLLHCPTIYFSCVVANHSDLWNERPNVKKWKDRLISRDAWKKAASEYINN